MPKVSVIIPVYNVEKYLKQCLDSVVNQTLKDIEIICIDDGSADNSIEILKEYAQKDNRFIILEQENQGAGAARNKGLSIATGEYVHFMDSDDWIETSAYQELYNLMTEKQADFIKFKAYSYNNETQEITTRPYLDIKWVDEKYFENYISVDQDVENTVKLPDSPWSGFYNREFLLKNNIYFDNFVCANDVGFFYRCIINAKRIYLSSNRYVYYRENLKNSLISRRARHFYCQTALFDVVKKESRKLPLHIRNILHNKIIAAIFGWHKKILKEYELDNKTQKRIEKEMKKFIGKISIEELNANNKKNYDELKLQIAEKRKARLQSLFSIQNIGVHKVFCILGIKLKIKSKKLVERERYKKLEKRLNKIIKEFEKLKSLIKEKEGV